MYFRRNIYSKHALFYLTIAICVSNLCLIYSLPHAFHVTPNVVICCPEDQWEASLYIDSGDVFIDANTFFAFINGTGRVAYDVINAKVYVNVTLTEYTPLMPTPSTTTMVEIKDYKKGIAYQISDDGSCQKADLQSDMTTYCIPVNAKKVSSGAFGGSGINFDTYQYTDRRFYPSNPIQTTVSAYIHGGTCEPLRISYFTLTNNPDSGTLYGLNVYNSTRGIVNPGIFVPPKSCG